MTGPEVGKRNNARMDPAYQAEHRQYIKAAYEKALADVDNPGQDPWKHRSAGMKCATCMYFVEKVTHESVMPDPVNGKTGRCRRHAPTMNGYPVVFQADWCGDHKLDETKV